MASGCHVEQGYSKVEMDGQTRGQRFPKHKIRCKDISRVDEMYDVGPVVAGGMSAFPGIREEWWLEGSWSWSVTVAARLERVWYAIHGWPFLR